jgi:tagatose 1,6-diphosphate aldolase
VTNAQFTELLEMAADAGAQYSGVLCGRATWKDGIKIYAESGSSALQEWLGTQGVANIEAVNRAVARATPWHARKI